MATALVIFIDLFPDALCIVFSCLSLALPAASPLSGFASCGSAERLAFIRFLQSSNTQKPRRLCGVGAVPNVKDWVFLLRVCSLGGGKRDQGTCFHAPLVCPIWVSFSASCQR